SNYVEKAVMRAIRNDVAILCIHTALDNALEGVNDRICEQLDLLNRKILIPKEETIRKLTTYVPAEKHENVRKALFEAGAGEIGKYSNCSFNIDGTGTFKGDDTSTPSYGEKGVFHSEKEIKLTLTFQKHLESGILKALFEAHPYEEVAFEVITLNNANQTIGMGMIGDLKTPMNEQDFLNFVKTRMNTSLIRHSALNKKTIKKVAVLGGSGSFAISSAQNAGADAYITADLKYHDFFQANESLLLMDIGHYESEQYTKSLLVQNLKKKMPNFAVILSDINTNPVKYF
ncbi:MAG: Nif3-like dinuclear metal center hexameric protein, partial [Bacteroidia bacterium]|nr:Nif3-like dinuclear metal center hexameric protein [Bacteroidia bacterium]